MVAIRDKHGAEYLKEYLKQKAYEEMLKLDDGAKMKKTLEEI